MKLAAKWHKAVVHYVKLLRLSEWDIETNIGKLSGGRGAEITFSSGEKRAVIILADDAILESGYHTETRSDTVYQAFGTTLDFLAAHEVVHVLVQPYDYAVSVAIEGQCKFVKEALSHEAEILVSSMARLLAALSPSGVR